MSLKIVNLFTIFYIRFVVLLYCCECVFTPQFVILKSNDVMHKSLELDNNII